MLSELRDAIRAEATERTWSQGVTLAREGRVTGLVQRGGGCRPSGSVATCAIGPGAPPLEFNVIGVPVSATATVTVPAGFTDPTMANNHDSVLLGLLRLGSLRG